MNDEVDLKTAGTHHLNEEKNFLKIQHRTLSGVRDMRLVKSSVLVAAMYEMYLNGNDGRGCSLAQVAEVYKCTRQNVYDRFKARGYELRSKEPALLQEVDGIRFVLNKKRSKPYLRGTLPDGRRVMIHRYVWEKAHGEIPPGLVVVHKNGDFLDNGIENLMLMKRSDMSAYFNPNGHNQFTAPELLRGRKRPG